MLRVTVRIAREGVYPYDRSEFGDDLNESLAGKQTIRLKISASEFTPESLATLEGKPVIIGTPGADSQHVWQDARITPENTVGSVAGTPRREGDDIIADFIITDADTIEKIKNGELCEVSAAYRSVIDEAGAGVFDEQPFDGTQRQLRYNHVLLLPEGGGRCGPDVRILNAHCVGADEDPCGGANPNPDDGDGESTMPQESKHEVKIGNQTYRFSNAENAEEAARMRNDAGQDSESRVKTMNEENTALKATVASLEKANAEHERVNKELAAKIAELEAEVNDEDDDEEDFQERLADEKDLEAVVENASDDEKAEIEKADEASHKKMGDAKFIPVKTRKRNAAVAIMNSRYKQDISGASDDTIAGVFKTLATQARTPGHSGEQTHVPVHQKMQNSGGGAGRRFCDD